MHDKQNKENWQMKDAMCFNYKYPQQLNNTSPLLL